MKNNAKKDKKEYYQEENKKYEKLYKQAKRMCNKREKYPNFEEDFKKIGEALLDSENFLFLELYSRLPYIPEDLKERIIAKVNELEFQYEVLLDLLSFSEKENAIEKLAERYRRSNLQDRIDCLYGMFKEAEPEVKL